MDKSMFGYIRVSTVKQGDGASLFEQKDSIRNYAQKHGIKIIRWFEEKETAAKQGRPAFSQMMKLLKRNKVDGVVIHKIDRSTRNLRDWADIGDLIDSGVKVHFTSEDLDLSSHGGRLAADMRALVSVDQIRIISSDTKKGQLGRLKQGIYPFGAPIGYLNTGRGNVKEPDPARSELITELFEMYSTGLYSILQMSKIMYNKGLRNSSDSMVTRQRISEILRNPFYMGLMKVSSMDELFLGSHTPLVSKKTFNRVQDLLHGKRHNDTIKREFLYRKCIKCALCGRSLIAERQRGHIYYRCQVKECPTKTVREEFIDNAINDFLQSINLTKEYVTQLENHFKSSVQEVNNRFLTRKRTVTLELSQTLKRLEVVTEKMLDGLVDDQSYKKIKEKLLSKKIEQEEEISQLDMDMKSQQKQLGFLKNLLDLKKLFQTKNLEQKKEILKMLTSNISYSAGKVEIQAYPPFFELSNTRGVYTCCQDQTRTSKGSKNAPKTFQNSNTIEYKLTKTKSGQFNVVRIAGEKLISDTDLITAISTNRRVCLKVVELLTSQENSNCEISLVA